MRDGAGGEAARLHGFAVTGQHDAHLAWFARGDEARRIVCAIDAQHMPPIGRAIAALGHGHPEGIEGAAPPGARKRGEDVMVVQGAAGERDIMMFGGVHMA